jgi:hypothetical protein
MPVPDDAQMNIERLYPLWFILCAAMGALLGSVTGYGAVRGLVDGLIVAASPLFLLMLALALMSLWRPVLPPCRCGKCTHKEYRHVSPASDIPSGIRFQCPECGRVYASSKERFDEITNDGRIVPYMRHTKWGRWRLSFQERQ